MQKTILITGATDGIGLEAAKKLAKQGHRLLIHGRNRSKLDNTAATLAALSEPSLIETYLADFSKLNEVSTLAEQVRQKHTRIDVLINNAGVYKTNQPMSESGIDVRFVVNTFAPYLLTQALMPILKTDNDNNPARVINLSSAAQAPVDFAGMVGKSQVPDGLNAYAQSKLAITMWSFGLAKAMADTGPVIIAVNPGSLLATKMVKEGFGVAGNDIQIGANILIELALNTQHAHANGTYFDNDIGQFSDPHPDALDTALCAALIEQLNSLVSLS